MSARADAGMRAQTIVGADGKPAFVVLPYEVFLDLFRNKGMLIPHEVVQAAVLGEASPAKAWRAYLQLTQHEIAQRLGITQPAYAKQENSGSLRPVNREQIAAALGLLPEQLEF